VPSLIHEPPLTTVSCPHCPVCGGEGKKHHAGVCDPCGFASGEWDFRRCGQCGSLWLDPRPADECASRIYPPEYLTHGAPGDLLGPGGLRLELRLALLHLRYGYPARECGGVVRGLARVAATLPGLTRRVGYGVRFVRWGPGRLLDIGCGNGEFLLLMSKLGWRVQGLDPDPVAAAEARRAGLPVENDRIESARLDPASFQAITLNHVLEHLADPVRVFATLSGWLEPGGVLVVVCPNPEGLPARRFGRAWRQLDAPRHLVLPSPAALAGLARRAGLHTEVWTSARMSDWTAAQSLPRSRWRARAAAWICRVAIAADRMAGDEVFLIARKSAA